MIHMSEAQASLFQQNVRRSFGKRPAGTPRVKKRKEDLPENIVTSQIKGFLETKGFLVIRQQSGLFKQRWGAQKPAGDAPEPDGMVRIGEKGVSDWRAEKPLCDELHRHLLFYLEMKAPGKTPKPEQMLWLERRRATGTPADWFDGFDTGRKPFIPWFRKMFENDLPLTNVERAEKEW